MSASDRLAEQGITISRIPADRYDEVVDLTYDHFCPDEPLCRSLKIGVPGEERNPFLDEFILESVEDGFMAVNKEGRIVGLRLGKIVQRGGTRVLDLKLGDLLQGPPRTAKAYGDFLLLMKVFAEIGYDIENAFEELNCTKVYEGKLLVVDRSSRAAGLGTELVNQSMAHAAEQGCEYIYLFTTGEYSARVMTKLDFTLARELAYENIKYADGEEVLNDRLCHHTARLFYKKLDAKQADAV